MTINLKIAVFAIWIIPLMLGVMVKKTTGLGEEIREVHKNGMTFRWNFAGGRLHGQVEAPGTGWVAVGFNSQPGLAGTCLIMGAVSEGKVKVENHYIIAPGDHQKVQELGEESALNDVEAWQNAKGTHLSFSLPIATQSKFQPDLRAGETFHLLLAYSRSDDFDHHSTMRTSINIKL